MLIYSDIITKANSLIIKSNKNVQSLKMSSTSDTRYKKILFILIWLCLTVLLIDIYLFYKNIRLEQQIQNIPKILLVK